jgi:hypothetical protein
MQAQIQKSKTMEMLEKLGQAISSGDMKTVSRCFGYPSMTLSDKGAMLIESAGQAEQMFGLARSWYLSQGIQTTRCELLSFEPLSKTVVAVDVRWPGFNSLGEEVYSETSHYLVHSSDGRPVIRAAVTRSS